MHDLNQTELENYCKELASAFKGSLSWKWDSRFDTVLADFGTDKKNGVRAILDQYFSNAWASANIGKAPDAVQRINRDLGKLRSGQLLFTTDPQQDTFIFCAWWPWGDGKTTSIRVAPYYKELSDSGKAEKTQKLKDCFGLRNIT
jgi:hypothetical protein